MEQDNINPTKDDEIEKLKHEKDYWKRCYEIAIEHLKQIENQYAIEHCSSFKYKEN